MKKAYKGELYRDVYIEYNVYRRNEYSVFWFGDDVIFSSLEEAKKFVDEMVDGKDGE